MIDRDMINFMYIYIYVSIYLNYVGFGRTTRMNIYETHISY